MSPARDEAARILRGLIEELRRTPYTRGGDTLCIELYGDTHPSGKRLGKTFFAHSADWRSGMTPAQRNAVLEEDVVIVGKKGLPE